MTFGESIGSCLRKYATVEGRASRSEYWWFFLFAVLLQVAGQVLAGDMVAGLIALALLLPGVGVGARRLHDIGRNGWWLLIGLIPLIGALVLLYWFVQPSAAANQHGEAPGAAPVQTPA